MKNGSRATIALKACPYLINEAQKNGVNRCDSRRFCRELDFLDLREVQFDRSISTKDADENFEFFLVGVDFFDSTLIVDEWAFDNADVLALVELHLWRFLALFQVVQDASDFIFLKRYWLVAAADEVSHTAGGLDELECFI